MQESKSHQAHAKARSPRRRIFTGAVAVVGSAGLAAAVLLPSGPALAAYQAKAGTNTQISIVVGSDISLSGVTPSFSFNGTGNSPLAPGDTPTPVTGAVTMNVYTDDANGYNVTAEALSDLTAPFPDIDTIPALDLSVEDNDTANTLSDHGAYQPLGAAGTETPVYSQSVRSALLGDLLTENWEFNQPIPDVTSGTYSTTIDFLASNNPT
jgi:hypothetical protein